MFAIFSNGGLSAGDVARLRRIERMLDLILQHLGLPFDEPAEGALPASVRELADAGQKIAAIKALREETRIGLREAKEAVEDYMGR